MNVFKELVHSIYDFKSYQGFLYNRKSKVFGYGLLLMLLYCLITLVLPFVSFQVETGGFAKLVNDNIPDFTLENGTLWVEKPLEFDYDNTYLCIDTDPSALFYGADEIGEYIRGYSQVILMDQEKIIVKDSGQIQELYFKDLDVTFSKYSLLEYVPYAYLIVFAFIVLAYVFMTAFFFFGVLIVALLGMIVASCMNKQFTFGQLYQMGIYSRTTPLFIKAVLSLMSITVPMFFLVNFGISLVYLWKGIQSMKEQEVVEPIVFDSNDWIQ